MIRDTFWNVHYIISSHNGFSTYCLNEIKKFNAETQSATPMHFYADVSKPELHRPEITGHDRICSE